MITKLHLENFKGHRDTTIELPRFAMLVGDNGSGKTSVLEALQLPTALHEHDDERRYRKVSEDPDLDQFAQNGSDGFTLTFSGKHTAFDWSTKLTVGRYDPAGYIQIEGKDSLGPFGSSWASELRGLGDALERADVEEVKLFRFRAERVAASAYGESPETTVAHDGRMTAVVLADLKLADDERFDKIQRDLQVIVPSLRRLQIRPEMVKASEHAQPVRGNKLFFDFVGAKDVPAHHASQGTLVTLALLTVLHSKHRPNVVLLDDFDHALHPRAQMELVRMLQKLLTLPDFQNTQIISTTHSPYVLDELSPEDVIALALREDGSVASKPLSQHPDATKSKGSLKAGELWTLSAERDWVL